MSNAMEAFLEFEERKKTFGKIVQLPGVSKATQEKPSSRFTLMTLVQVLAMPPAEWLVQDLLPRRGLAVWFGAPGSGKTFLTLDVAMSLATGHEEWFGRDVKPVNVIYVAGEGVTGLGNRLRAWVSRHCNPDADVHAHISVVPEPPNLFTGDAAKFIQDVSTAKPGLVVLDTLARCAAGADENSARDMGQVVAAADMIVRELNCCVLLVHHSGRMGHERGSTALRGAADIMLEIKQHESGTRELVLGGMYAKLKDAEGGGSIPFRLEREGDSCVVVRAEGVSDRPPLPKGQWQRFVFELAGQALREKSALVEGRPAITFDELLERWRAAVKDARKREPGELRRILLPMIAAGVLDGSESAIFCP